MQWGGDILTRMAKRTTTQGSRLKTRVSGVFQDQPGVWGRKGRHSPLRARISIFGNALAGFAVLTAVSLILVSCGPSAEVEAQAREEIEAMLSEYLPTLGTAYTLGEPQLLKDFAVRRELNYLGRRIDELGIQGKRLSPELREIVIEDVNLWNRLNAQVTTVETWDLRVLALGSGAVLSEDFNQVSQVRYQIKFKDDRWWIYSRVLEQTFE